MMGQPHIVVVGAGIVGLATAYALLKQGQRAITVLEQAEIDHKRGASHGFSRLLRFEYGADYFYSDMVRRSLRLWHEFERVTGRALYTPTGVLMLGKQGDGFTYPSYRTARGMGLPVERLEREACRQRFPQFPIENFDTYIYNAEGGILHASACLRALRDAIRDLGGTITEGRRVAYIAHESQKKPLKLRLSSGETLAADRVIVATGPWVHRLLEEERLPVRMTRQYLLYFAGLPAESYQAGACPAFLADNLYGFPIHQGCNGWVKATSHDYGAPVSPDEVPTPDFAVIEHIREQLHAILPALRHAELAHIDMCMYDVSPDENFILDRLPCDPRIVFATGLSGHGFKFGLLLGELLSSLLSDTDPVVPLGRFRLGRFRKEAQKSSVA